jgi:putative MATE family efflux protein
MLAVSREDITDGPLGRALVLLSVPLIAQNLVQIATLVVDIFWLGRLAEGAVAGVGLVIPILGVGYAMLYVGTVGTQVVVAQRAGEEDDAGLRRAAVNGVFLSVAFGIVVGAVLAALAPSLVGLLDPGPAVVPYAVSFLTVYALGFPVLFASDALESGLIGVGDTRGAFLLNALAVGLNLVLDPILIFGWFGAPALGVRGAALATILGYAAGFGPGLVLVRAGRHGLRYTRQALRPDRGTLREIVDVGLPNAGQSLGQEAARVGVVAVVSATGGGAGLAAYTVGMRVASIAVVPAISFQHAVQSVVGQNLGAEKPARARRATWLGVAIAVGGLAVLGVGQWAAPLALAELFVPDLSPDATALTVDYLRILAYGYPAIGATYLLLAGFNGARRTRTSMVATLLQYWGIRVPVAAVGGLLLGVGVHAAFWAVTLSNVAAACGVGWYYRWATADGMLTRAAAEATE